jgi:hypothetical protein
MHEYDTALKVLLQASTDSLLRQLAGVSVARWLNVGVQKRLRYSCAMSLSAIRFSSSSTTRPLRE